MKTGRLNVYIPEPELEAFKAWCKDRGMSQSRALTGILHTFNARQQKARPQEPERLDAASRHQRYVDAKRQGQEMVEAVKRDPHWTTNSLKKSESVDRLSADFLDLE